MSINYTVKSGDTLWRIAQRVCGDGNQYAAIAEANNLQNPDLIFVGQILTIPCTDDTDVIPIAVPEDDNTTFLEGIDVSVWQDDINWKKVSEANITFAIARATYGTTTDTWFIRNWHAMESQGMIRGAYHYYRVHQDSNEQVRHFLDTVTLRARDLPPVLDIELAFNEGASQRKWSTGVRNWLEKVQEATGRMPIIYTSRGAWGQTVNSRNFGDYPLWVANWGVDQPILPAGWDNWYFWQYTDKGKVDGIAGNVDLDKFNGTRQKLEDFISLS